MNAVIYARYSSDKQTEQSIEGQLRICHEYAERCGYTVVGEYIDRAMTGRYDDRPEFQRMLADAKKHQFSYIIVYKLDRFARNRYDSAVHKHNLKKEGVRVVSAMENIGDNAESILLEALLEASAEYYSVDLSQKVKRGMNESALKANSCGGTIPLGYRVENKKLVINEKTAPIAKLIFDLYSQGIGKKKIAEELNNRGYRTVNNKPFTHNSFNTIFDNKKYIGIYTYDGIEIEGGCPALVDKETFDKCKRIAAASKRAPGSKKAKVNYQLSGKLFCGMCGATMVGESGRGSQNVVYNYYCCSDKKKKRTCKKKNEKKDFIEWYVVEQTLQYVLNKRRIKYIAKRVAEMYEREFDSGQVEAIEKDLRKVEKEIAQTTETLIKTEAQSAIDYINEKLVALDARKANITMELAKLKVAQKARITEESVIAWLKSFCNGDLHDLDFRQKIIDVLVNSVYLYDDKVVIYYNVKDGKQVCFIEMLDDTDEINFCDVINKSSDFRSDGVPRRSKLCLLRFFLAEKINRPRRCSSFFAKRPARLVCALATARCRCHLFASTPAARKISKLFTLPTRKPRSRKACGVLLIKAG